MKSLIVILFINVNLLVSTKSNTSLDVVNILINSLQNVLSFVDQHHNEINLDGLVGLTIAEGQIINVLQNITMDIPYEVGENLQKLTSKFERIRHKIQPLLPTSPSKMLLFQQFFLNPDNWNRNIKFSENELDELGIYKNWTAKTILNYNRAVFHGIPTDVCIEEILDPENEVCSISSLCEVMMLRKRIDTGYLLSHRLLYLQVADMKKCTTNKSIRNMYSIYFCSLMLKEARTNEYLDYPYHDIFLEQMTLCGLEGYAEFLTERWTDLLIYWQTKQGCYRSKVSKIARRSSTMISYGCSDHSTGLGAATLALNIKYLLNREL